jgi:hypothetical protein
MPMMSPVQASSARLRAGEEKHRGLHRHQAPGADVLQFHMLRRKRPEASRI